MKKIRPARNSVVVAMMKRSQKAGAHRDHKKYNSKTQCRKPVTPDE